MFAVFGLGNPGVKYRKTRHNIGFDIVSCLASRWQMEEPNRKKHHALVSDGQFLNQKILLVMPQTFMNLSGKSVSSVMSSKRITGQQCIVVHDELALPFGTVRCKNGGGHGGHNGLRNITQCIGADYLRVRFGVNQAPEGWDTARYVLGRFSPTEQNGLEGLIERAVDVVEAIIERGIDAAMNTYNIRQTQ